MDGILVAQQQLFVGDPQLQLQTLPQAPFEPKQWGPVRLLQSPLLGG